MYSSKSRFKSETLDIVIQSMKSRGIIFFDHQSTAQEHIDICMHYIQNLGDKDSEFLCYGITDDINKALTKIDGLQTPSIKTIVNSKEISDLDDLIKKYDVDYIIRGDFMKISNQMRLSISMHNTSSGKELWLEKWECQDQGLQDIQNKILIKVLDSIGIEAPKTIKLKSYE